ncbi:MAG TPA: O-antigen ligase family protein [Chthoniobacterales bacterium]
MSGQIILYACYGFIIWLFRKDIAWRRLDLRALLIPGAWIAIQGSRPLSYWFGGGSGDEPNPINTLAFAAFFVVSVAVLLNRGLDWGRLVSWNMILFLIYGYLLMSAFWSDEPLVSIKRLFKDFGCVVVALIFLTETNFAEAIRAIYVRVSYLLFPLSVVFIKYFPEIGRNSSRAGENMFTGVTTQKNTLGETVFVFSLMLIWDLTEICKEGDWREKKLPIYIRVGMLFIGLWLLLTCDSQTSLLCLILGAVIFWSCNFLTRLQHGKGLLFSALIAAAFLFGTGQAFDLSIKALPAMGRDATFTGRTDIWRLVLEQQQSPLTGFGYYVFWDSEHGTEVKDAFMQINSAHNGFLEMYLDGGLAGCILLGFFLLVSGWRVINRLFDGHALGRMGLVFWLLSIVYNFSESSFFRLDVLWFTLLLVTLERPQTRADL